MMAFAGIVEPLRVANRMSQHRLFTWEVLSEDGQPVTASNGIQIIGGPRRSRGGRTQLLIVFQFSARALRNKNAACLAEKQASHGARIGALDGCHLFSQSRAFG